MTRGWHGPRRRILAAENADLDHAIIAAMHGDATRGAGTIVD